MRCSVRFSDFDGVAGNPGSGGVEDGLGHAERFEVGFHIVDAVEGDSLFAGVGGDRDSGPVPILEVVGPEDFSQEGFAGEPEFVRQGPE